MNSDYKEITQVVNETTRLDSIHLQIMEVLDFTQNTYEPWCSIRFLRDAIGYVGGGGWFTLALEIGAEKGYFWVVRCGHRIYVTAKRDGFEIFDGDFIPENMIRE